MPTAPVAERWYDLAADLGRQGTTAVEAAARRGINWCGDFTLERQPWGRLARIGLGDSGEERPRIRVLRVRKYLLYRPHFDDLANVHHRHTVTDVPNHTEVVCDEEVGQIEVFLQLAEEVEDLRLNRHIER